MPTYEYLCEGCQHEFTLVQTMAERERADVTCPKCQGATIKPLVSAFIAQTSRKS